MKLTYDVSQVFWLTRGVCRVSNLGLFMWEVSSFRVTFDSVPSNVVLYANVLFCHLHRMMDVHRMPCSYFILFLFQFERRTTVLIRDYRETATLRIRRSRCHAMRGNHWEANTPFWALRLKCLLRWFHYKVRFLRSQYCTCRVVLLINTNDEKNLCTFVALFEAKSVL